MGHRTLDAKETKPHPLMERRGNRARVGLEKTDQGGMQKVMGEENPGRPRLPSSSWWASPGHYRVH